MKTSSVNELVDRLCQAKTDRERTTQAVEVKLAAASMQKSIDSLEGQLRDFYDAQVEHDGATLEDYKRMVVSLNEQVVSYIDDRIDN